MRNFERTRFDDADGADLGPDLPNLADLMLVFVTGLIAALAAATGSFAERRALEDFELGRELPQLPASADAEGSGLESVGRVFRDPETGTLYVIE